MLAVSIKEFKDFEYYYMKLITILFSLLFHTFILFKVSTHFNLSELMQQSIDEIKLENIRKLLKTISGIPEPNHRQYNNNLYFNVI